MKLQKPNFLIPLGNFKKKIKFPIKQMVRKYETENEEKNHK